MGLYDSVEGILPPYQNQFKLWGCTDATYKHGSLVPVVGLAKTYAVLLKSDGAASPRYLWVQENNITQLMAHQPIHDHNVFDKWGNYLGRAGSDYKPKEVPPPAQAKSLLEQLSEQDAKRNSPEPLTLSPELEKAMDEAMQAEGPDDSTTEIVWEDDVMEADQGSEASEDPMGDGPGFFAEVYTHKLILRDNFEVSLTLPKDLTSDEATRLGAWAEALVISRGPRF